MQNKLSRYVLIDRLDTMLIRTIADIHDEYGRSATGKQFKEEIRKAYKQIKQLIEQSPEWGSK